MAKLSQNLNLSQSLRITPQLQQAIKMLQLSRLELENSVRKELEENPMLEETAEVKEEDIQLAKDAEAELGGEIQQDPKKQDEFEWDSYMESQNKPPPQTGMGHDEIASYENIISVQQSLHDYLAWQARMWGFTDEERKLVEILIEFVDDDGYLLTPLSEIAEHEKVPEPELQQVLPFLQEFDPAGVGARDLKECLILQLRALEEDTQDMVSLVQNHLKDLERRSFETIAKAMGSSTKIVSEMAQAIYALNPKPGRAFSVPETQYVMPDAYVYKVGDEYMVSLNEDGLPRLKISNFYRNMLKSGSKDQTQDYIQDKLRSAVWLIKSIHQRQRTIYKVTESIVKHQKEFLEKGPSHMKPLVLRDIAQDIGMHESTVSRVTTSKYVHTPQGIFELKYFFNSGISTSDGVDVASESVKLKIRDLISKEDARRPLSDQDLVEMLKKDSIQIARRTVAKYREALKILPSSRRRKIHF